jgi:hypothetical protein
MEQAAQNAVQEMEREREEEHRQSQAVPPQPGSSPTSNGESAGSPTSPQLVCACPCSTCPGLHISYVTPASHAAASCGGSAAPPAPAEPAAGGTGAAAGRPAAHAHNATRQPCPWSMAGCTPQPLHRPGCEQVWPQLALASWQPVTPALSPSALSPFTASRLPGLPAPHPCPHLLLLGLAGPPVQACLSRPQQGP